jgi:hypothetical protein
VIEQQSLVLALRFSQLELGGIAAVAAVFENGGELETKGHGFPTS